jgi:hypothetical protein
MLEVSKSHLAPHMYSRVSLYPTLSSEQRKDIKIILNSKVNNKESLVNSQIYGNQTAHP